MSSSFSAIDPSTSLREPIKLTGPSPGPHANGQHRSPPPPSQDAARPSSYEPMKSLVDLALAVILLVLFLPVIVIAAVAVRLTSSGPSFYSQLRLGKDGRLFRILKLR